MRHTKKEYLTIILHLFLTLSIIISAASASNISIGLIYPTGDVNATQHEWFPVIVNVTCKGPANCGLINVSLDPKQTIVLTENNVTADVKYGSAGTGPNGGGQIQWTLPQEIQYKTILNATMCFYNRDLETTQFLKQIWLIDESDHWDESSNAATLNSQTKILAVNATSSCGTAGCWACHNITALVQKAADLGYSNATFRIEAADTPIRTNINSVTDHDGLEPGTYWVFDDREHSQFLGGPNLTIDYVTAKGLISTTPGATPFWTNDSNPRQINLSINQSQTITFWVNATSNRGRYEFFAYANRTANPNDSNRTRSWNVTIYVDYGVLVNLLSPPDSTNTADLSNTTLQCSASTYAGKLTNITVYDNINGWMPAETQNASGKQDQANFTRNYEQNRTFIDTGITWNCLAKNNRSNTAFAANNYKFSNWGLGTRNGVEIQNNKLAFSGNKFTNIIRRAASPNSTDEIMSVKHDNTTNKTFYAWAEEDGSGINQIWTAIANSDNTGWTPVKRTNALRSMKNPNIAIYNNKVYTIYQGDDTINNARQLWLGTMNTDGSNWTEQQLTNYTMDSIDTPRMTVDDRTGTIYVSYIKNNHLWLGAYNITGKTFNGTAINTTGNFIDSHIFLDKTTDRLYFIADRSSWTNTNLSHVSTNLSGGNYTETYLPAIAGGTVIRGASDAAYDTASGRFYYATSHISGSAWQISRGACNKDGSNSTWILTNSSTSTHTIWPRINLARGIITMMWAHSTTTTTPYTIAYITGKFAADSTFSQIGTLQTKTDSTINAPIYYDAAYDSTNKNVKILFQRFDNTGSNIQGIYTADWLLEETGTYTSRIFNATQKATWLNLTYTGTIPAGANLTINYRTSDDASNWSNWTPTSSLPSTKARYFQYQAKVNSTNIAQIATIDKITVKYSALPTPTVTLHSPANRNWTVSMNNTTFNCSATTPANSTLTNISLYSNFNGTWQLIETQNIGGTQGYGIFTYSIAAPYLHRDTGVRWNCIAYNNYSNYDWGNRNFYFASWDRGTHNNTKVTSTGLVQINQTSQTVNTWNDITQGQVPLVTIKGGMIYDTITKETIYFGGQNASGTVGPTNYPNTTWTYDYYTKNWTDVTSQLINAPDFNSMIYAAGYDFNLKLIVAYAEKQSTGQDAIWHYNNSNKTWSYSNITSTPQIDKRRATIHDSTDNIFATLGNASNGNNYLWLYNYTSDTWTNISLGANAPINREVMASAHDYNAEIYLFFGGSNKESPPWGTEYNETWMYNKSTSTLTNITGISKAPAPRTYINTLVYDPQKNAIVLFGGAVYDPGTGDVNTYNDTWYFDSSTLTWTEQNFAINPPGAGAGAMQYMPHPDKDIILLVNGFNKYQASTTSFIKRNTTWELASYKNYTERKTDFAQQVNVTNGTILGYMNDWTAYITGTGNIIIQGNAGPNWPGVARFNTSNEATDAAILSNTNPLPTGYAISTAAAIDAITGIANPALVTIGIFNPGTTHVMNSTTATAKFKTAIAPIDMGPVRGIMFEYQDTAGGINFWDGTSKKWSLAPAIAAPFNYGAWYGHELRKTETSYIFIIRNLTTGKAIEMVTVPISAVLNGSKNDEAIIGDMLTDWQAGIMRISNLTIKTEQSEGEYQSEAIDSGQTSDWTYIGWTASAPNGTNTTISIRTSDDSINWTNWSIINTNPTNNIANAKRYLQYKMLLETQGQAVPSLSDVLVNYTARTQKINMTLLLNLMTQQNSTKTITIYRSGTSQIITTNSTNATNITFTIDTGTYDIKIECPDLNSAIQFNGITVSSNSTHNITLDLLGRTGNLLRIFAAETDMNITSADIAINYQGTQYTNENLLYIDKCSSWNITAQKCPGNWQKQQTTINKTAKTASCTVNNLSGFGVAQGSAAAAGGGGGGSARRSYENAIIENQETEQNTQNAQYPQLQEKTQAHTKEQESKTTVKAPEIKTEKQKDKTELKILQYIPNTKAIIPGILAVALLFGAAAYFTLKTPMPNNAPKPSRRKDNIELEKHGFRVKK